MSRWDNHCHAMGSAAAMVLLVLVISFALPLIIFTIFSIIFTPHPAKLTALIAEYMKAFMKLWDVFLSLIGVIILSAICKYISRL